MSGCTENARNGCISTSGEKSDITIVFLDPDFLKGSKNFGNLAINKGYIANFSLRMHETTVFPLPGLKSDVTIVFLDPDFHEDAKILAIRIHLRQI